MTEISGRAAVVTGGGSGIGRGLAKALAAAGASVAIADIQLDRAQAVADEIVAGGGRAVAIACDVCERGSVQALATAATETLGPVQLVFANAGATAFTPLAEMSEDDIEWIVQVNLMGTFHTVRAFLPGMIAAGGGHIVATSSVAGLMPGMMANHAPYASAKAGIIAMMMNLSVELAPHGIRTTAYCPGGVASSMKARNGLYRPARYGGADAETPAGIGADPTRDSALRFYRPEDIAPMVLDAVRAERRFVFDHPEQRAGFRLGYADLVEAGYDAAEAWEREHGAPPANPTGADLDE